MRRTTTLLTGLVVALLLALAGNTTASATVSAHHAAVSGHHATTPSAVAVPQHRTTSTPRPHVTVVGHLGHDLMLQVVPLRTTRTAAEHEPVIATSFCTNDRAPPV
jgi:hypothetical protein